MSIFALSIKLCNERLLRLHGLYHVPAVHPYLEPESSKALLLLNVLELQRLISLNVEAHDCFEVLVKQRRSFFCLCLLVRQFYDASFQCKMRYVGML